jgi:hypothetical protein
MLDTRLADAERYPLKVGKLIFSNVGPTSVPIQVFGNASPATQIQTPSDYPVNGKLYRAAGFSQEFGAFQGTHMYVDPAGGGQNGDETAYAVTRFSAGRVFLVAIGGVPGGLDEAPLKLLTDIAAEFKPSMITIEKNYGNGALSSVWQPSLFKRHPCEIEDYWETGQKELRIIDTLEPIIGSHRLIVDESLIESDWASVQKYPAATRASYSLFSQLEKITRDRGSLAHDDRLDALAGSARHWVEDLAQDDQAAVYAAQRKAYADMMANPLGNGRSMTSMGMATKYSNNRPTAIAALKRRF